MPATSATDILEVLLRSDEPSIRWKARVGVCGEDRRSKQIRALEDEIRRSQRVRALLARRDRAGRLVSGNNVYDKWQGAHWVLASLADLGYPGGDESLAAMGSQVLDYWLHERFYEEFDAARKADAYKKEGVPRMQGRYRRCASQQGNALHFLTRLGIADGRTERLVERLLHWQWPDGGWNCDRDPEADTSSFMETLLPLRGLAAHAEARGDANARAAASRAAEVFLERRMFKRRADGRIMDGEFVLLHYPLYWHYDVLGGLKVMAEAGLVRDPRCADALDWLEAKRLPDGGWPAEKRYYKLSEELEPGADSVDWGGTSKKRMNGWVTADALVVLRAAGRISI